MNTSRHDSVIRYAHHSKPLEQAAVGHGAVHGIESLYEKVDEDEFEGTPYEEPVVFINSVLYYICMHCGHYLLTIIK